MRCVGVGFLTPLSLTLCLYVDLLGLPGGPEWQVFTRPAYLLGTHSSKYCPQSINIIVCKAGSSYHGFLPSTNELPISLTFLLCSSDSASDVLRLTLVSPMTWLMVSQYSASSRSMTPLSPAPSFAFLSLTSSISLVLCSFSCISLSEVALSSSASPTSSSCFSLCRCARVATLASFSATLAPISRACLPYMSLSPSCARYPTLRALISTIICSLSPSLYSLPRMYWHLCRNWSHS